MSALTTLDPSLLEAISDAVFGYLLEHSDLAATLRARWQQEPDRLAFRIALARACATFARNYPQWTASLFEESFLPGRAAPLLARCLLRDAPPDPAELATVWAEQRGVHPLPVEAIEGFKRAMG